MHALLLIYNILLNIYNVFWLAYINLACKLMACLSVEKGEI